MICNFSCAAILHTIAQETESLGMGSIKYEKLRRETFNRSSFGLKISNALAADGFYLQGMEVPSLILLFKFVLNMT